MGDNKQADEMRAFEAWLGTPYDKRDSIAKGFYSCWKHGVNYERERAKVLVEQALSAIQREIKRQKEECIDPAYGPLICATVLVAEEHLKQALETREERRHTKPEFNGCVRYKRGEYCQPCVAMASNYTYTGENDRRAFFHQYAENISESARYEAALREAREALKQIEHNLACEQYVREYAGKALATIDKLLGVEP